MSVFVLLVGVFHGVLGCSCGGPVVDGPAAAVCLPVEHGPAASSAQRGVLRVLAGEGGAGYVDGPAPRTNGVGGLARRDDGRLIVSDIFNGTLRQFDPATGRMATVAGFPLAVGATDGGCDEARLNGPRGLASDPDDNAVVWFGDGPCLRRANLDSGDVSTVAGSCSSPGDVDGDAATSRFAFLFHDVEVAADGRVFIADRGNDVIRVFDQGTGTTTTLAGGFDGPGSMFLDGTSLYVADTFHHSIAVVDIDSGAVTHVAGQPGVAGSDDGTFDTGTLDSPQALSLVGETLVVAGFDGHIRAVDVRSGAISTVTRLPVGFFAPFLSDGADVVGVDLDGVMVRIGLDGTVTRVFGPVGADGYQDGAGPDARFSLPACVVGTPDGDAVFVSDSFNAAIRRVELSSGLTTTVLGGPDVAGNVDGPAATARLAFPSGLALSADGSTLFIVDTGNNALRSLDLGTSTVSTIGTGLNDPWEIAVDDVRGVAFMVESAGARVVAVDLDDGTVTAVSADLVLPVGLALVDGRLFVADNEDHVIREIDVDGGTSTVVLGSPGFQGSADGSADFALLNFPAGLGGRVEAGVPVLYVAETGGQTIRRVDLVTFESRYVVGDPLLSGALPAGSTVSLAGAPILNPNDVTVVGDDIVIVGDTTVVAARP